MDPTASTTDGLVSAAGGQSQVKIQLSTRHPDISLTKNPGPILVNTSNVIVDVLS